MKTALLAILLHAAMLLSAQQTITTIYFENDVYSLSRQNKEVIKQLAADIQQKDIKSIILFGYADSSANSDYNIQLSENRNASVLAELNRSLPENYLPSKNIEPVLRSLGEDIPENMRPKLHYGQRCVDIIVNEKQEVIVRKNSINDLYDKLKPSPQVFCVNNNRDTLLRAKNGTLIYVKANSFDIASLNLTSACLKFKIIEGYSNADMILNNLITQGDEKQLETGGMLYVQAEVNGVNVPLKEGADIVYMLPANKTKDDMQVFLGQEKDKTAMNWKNTGQKIEYFNAWDFLSRRALYETHYHCDFWCRFSNYFRSDDNPSLGWSHERFESYEYSTKQIDSLLAAYGVKNYDQLQSMLKKERMQKIETDAASASSDDWNYYIYNSTNLGWMNCDRFYDVPEKLLTNVEINFKKEEGTDAKLVFRSMKSILAPDYNKSNYSFSKVKLNEPVWLFAVKYENDKIFMCLKSFKIEKDMTFIPEFKECTMPELKNALKWLNT